MDAESRVDDRSLSDPRRKGFRLRATVADVLATIDARVNRLNTQEIPLTEAAGRVLAHVIVAAEPVPHRVDDPRFTGCTVAQAIDRACADPSCLMVSRNRGSGTRVLIDGLLAGRRPPGHAVEVRSHNAVAAAVSQKRADWGVAIEPVVRAHGLAFLPVRAEQYDFAIPADRWDRPAVASFRQLCAETETMQKLAGIGMLPSFQEARS